MNTLSTEEVKAILDDIRNRNVADFRQSARTEIQGALQLKNPPPYSDHPPHLAKQTEKSAAFSREEADEIAAHQRAQVTDAEHIAFSKIRGKHPYILDGHHYAQWKHGSSLWEEADRIVNAIFGGPS